MVYSILLSMILLLSTIYSCPKSLNVAFATLQPLVVSILSERRAFQPYGICGGEPAARGVNLLYLAKDDRTISLGGKNTVNVQSGDRLTIHTPGNLIACCMLTSDSIVRLDPSTSWKAERAYLRAREDLFFSSILLMRTF